MTKVSALVAADVENTLGSARDPKYVLLHNVRVQAYQCVQAEAESEIVKDGWFTELSTLWLGQGLSLKVKEILFHERSEFQARLHVAR
jgi:hypothetical protein